MVSGFVRQAADGVRRHGRCSAAARARLAQTRGGPLISSQLRSAHAKLPGDLQTATALSRPLHTWIITEQQRVGCEKIPTPVMNTVCASRAMFLFWVDCWGPGSSGGRCTVFSRFYCLCTVAARPACVLCDLSIYNDAGHLPEQCYSHQSRLLACTCRSGISAMWGMGARPELYDPAARSPQT